MTAVHEVMSSSPVTVAPTTSVGDLLARFGRHDFNAFPVVDEGGRLVGIVSKLDVLEFFLASRTPWNARTMDRGRVAELMRHRVVSIEPSDSIADAGALMAALKLRSLPVVERRGGRPTLVGIVSRGDVLRGLTHQASTLRGGVREVNEAAEEMIEMLIDEMGRQSFPASDPPAWGAVSSRRDLARRGSSGEDKHHIREEQNQEVTAE
jgi:CBS domain-containing protein